MTGQMIEQDGYDLRLYVAGQTPKSVAAIANLKKLCETHLPGRYTIEVIDLRTLSPYDWQAIQTSVTKTNRVMVVHEDNVSWGYGAEIAARIADELFGVLDAPVRRIGALDTWVGYHPQLENAILPQVDDVMREAEKLLSY